MDLEKLTERARGFLQAAQTIAVREHHQRIAPGHLLKALLDDEQGMAAGLMLSAARQKFLKIAPGSSIWKVRQSGNGKSGSEASPA